MEIGPSSSSWGVVNSYLRDRCTIHGYPRLCSGSRCRRVFWFLVNIGFTVFGTYQLILTFQAYYVNPTITSFEVNQPDRVPFPSVTICSLQPFANEAFTYNKNQTDYRWLIKTIPVLNLILREYFVYCDRGFRHCTVPEGFRNRSNVERELNEIGINASGLESDLIDFETYLRVNYTGLFPSQLTPFIQKALNITQNDMDETLDFQRAMLYVERLIGWSQPILEEEKTYLNLTFAWQLKHLLKYGNLSWNGKHYEVDKEFNVQRDDYLTILLTRSLANSMISINTSYRWGDNLEKEEYNFEQFLSAWQNMKRKLPLKWSLKLYNEARWAYNDLFWQGKARELSRGGKNGVFHLRGYYQALTNQFSALPPKVVKSCTFQHRDCLQDLYNTIDPRWKSCIHFNNEFIHRDNLRGDPFSPTSGRIYRKEPLQVKTTGRTAGLVFKLIPQNSSFQEFLNPLDGFVVAVGDSGTMPTLDQYIQIPGRGYTDLAIQRKEINRLDSSSGGSCVDKNYYEVAFPEYELLGNYNQNICSQMKLFFTILKECECIENNDILGGIIEIKNLTDRFETCSFMKLPCLAYASDVFKDSSTEEACPPACREVKYDTFFSSITDEDADRRIPSNVFDQFRLYSEVAAGAKEITLTIYYKTKSVEVITEILVSKPISLIANIGGIAGLCIGMSLVSVVEVLELIFELFFLKLSNAKVQESTFAGDSEQKMLNDGREVVALRNEVQALRELVERMMLSNENTD